jgi:ArsR family transcriptional regulator
MNRDLEREVDQLHAEICAGLAEPTRILILYELAERTRNVTELANNLSLSQPLVSRHLKVLRDRGMVTATRVGAAVEYQLADRRFIQALDILRDILRDSLTRRAQLVDAFDESSSS